MPKSFGLQIMSKSLKGKIYYVETDVWRGIQKLSRHIDVVSFGDGQYCYRGFEIYLVPLILRSEIEMKVDHQVRYQVRDQLVKKIREDHE